MTPPPGKLVVISGPSGAGKTTVCNLLAEDPRVRRSISATTRAPRRGEVHGRDYYFLERDEMQSRIAEGGFVEHAEVFGQLYGTPRPPLEAALKKGKVFLLDIDVQGAQQLMAQYPDGIYIFLEPPDFDELSRRLDGRRTESVEQKSTRLGTAPKEMALRDRYTHRVVNDQLDRTVDEIRKIIFTPPDAP